MAAVLLWVGAGGSAVADVHFFEIRHFSRPAEVSRQLYLIATLCSAAGTSHFAKDPLYSSLQGRLPRVALPSLPTNRADYSVLIASATYCVALATWQLGGEVTAGLFRLF